MKHDGLSHIEADSFDEFAATILSIFPAAMEKYAVIGRAIFKAMTESGLDEAIAEGPEPGRNDPCPCGSGKKFKKCCL